MEVVRKCLNTKTIVGLLFVIMVAAVMYYNGGQQVTVVAVTKGDVTAFVEETGYVQAQEEYELLAPESGYLIQVGVERGQTVKKGQPLMSLDNPDYDQQAELVQENKMKAQAELANAVNNRDNAQLSLVDAKRELERNYGLLAAGAVSQSQMDAAQLAVDKFSVQTASLNQIVARISDQLATLEKQQTTANKKVSRLTINSPVDGMVLWLPLKEGQWSATGTLLAKVGQSGITKVYADIISDDMASIKVGMTALISSPVLGGKKLTGVISQIYPQAQEKISSLGVLQRRVRVMIDLSDPANLMSGYEVKVAIPAQHRSQVLVIPREALFTNNKGEYEVFIAQQNTLVKKKVRIGLKSPVAAEITDGLQEGELVVCGNNAALDEKMRVKAVLQQ